MENTFKVELGVPFQLRHMSAQELHKYLTDSTTMIRAQKATPYGELCHPVLSGLQHEDKIKRVFSVDLENASHLCLNLEPQEGETVSLSATVTTTDTKIGLILRDLLTNQKDSVEFKPRGVLTANGKYILVTWDACSSEKGNYV